MKTTRFDKLIDRRVYPTQKWNPADLQQFFGSEAVLPFWIADMDFPAPTAVLEALQKRVAHGIFGYEYKKDSYFAAVTDWYKTRHGWNLPREHIQFGPGVLASLAILINQHSAEGEGVILQPPVFFEFKQVIRKNGRKLSKNPLILEGSQYRMDFADLEAKAADPRNKILILCNPHNPIGRVWTREELAQVDEICRRHNVRVIADEIHGDIVYPPHQYTPFASLSEAAADNAFILFSPAKTFNLAGMIDGMAAIANKSDRHLYDQFVDRYQVNRNNVFTAVAVETAYREGGPWLDELLAYLYQNAVFTGQFLAENVPQVKLIEPEGTYLVWLDFRGLGLDVKALQNFLAQEAGLALNAGHWFGREGAGFARMNIAVPRPLLEEAMGRLEKAVSRLEHR